jgi:hypothetical protein
VGGVQALEEGSCAGKAVGAPAVLVGVPGLGLPALPKDNQRAF